MLKSFVDASIAAEENNIITLEDLLAFYRENIASGLSDFTNLELEGFVCIQGFFTLINSRAGNLRIIGAEQQPATTG